jgi:hypothetical protein
LGRNPESLYRLESKERWLPSYRLFKIDIDRRTRSPGEWLEAAHDDEALKIARHLPAGWKCEVWIQDRLVGIVDAN